MCGKLLKCIFEFLEINDTSVKDQEVFFRIDLERMQCVQHVAVDSHIYLCIYNSHVFHSHYVCLLLDIVYLIIISFLANVIILLSHCGLSTCIKVLID